MTDLMPDDGEFVERIMRSAQTLALAVHFKQPKEAQDALRSALRLEVQAALSHVQPKGTTAAAFDDLRHQAMRALVAWDGTVLPKAHDGLMQERMECLRAALEAAQSPAEGDALPPLPKVGPIGFASVVDVESYALWLKIGPHLPGVRDVALWTTDQMRAYARAALPAVQPKAAEAPEIGEVTWQQAADAIENLDDYARMMVGVDPSGPRETLYRFLEQAKAALANVQPKGTELTPDEIQALWSPYAGAAPFAFARKIEAAIAAKGSPTQAPAPAPGLNSDDFLQLSAEVWPADAPRTGERAWWPAQLKTQLCPRMADLTHFGALVEREVLRRVSESQAPAVKDAARVAAKWYLQAHNRMNLAGEAIAISIGHEIDREGFLAGIHDNELARSVTDWMRKIDRRNGELATAGPTDRALMRKALEALEAYSRWAASMDVEMQAHNAITDLRTALDGESDVPVQGSGS